MRTWIMLLVLSMTFVTVQAGETDSNFIPAVGERSNINLNSADDVDYDKLCGIDASQRWWNGYGGNNSFASMVTSYSGSVWAPEYGTSGAIIVHGGGHGGQIGAFAYLFDIASRTWRQVGAPRNLPPTSEWSGYANAKSAIRNNALEQRDSAWMDYNYNGSYIKFSDHEYLQNAYIPPAMGGGPYGSLLLPQATYSQDPGVADPRTGIAYRWAPHLFSLEDGKMTRASAAPLGEWAAYSNMVAVRDTKRNKLWYLRQAWSMAFYHDLTAGTPYAAGTHIIQKRSGGAVSWIQSGNSSWLYVPEADAMVGFVPTINGGYPWQHNMPVGVSILDMSTGVPVDLERTVATQPFYHGGLFAGAAWCPTLHKFYIYEGMGDTFCHVLTPSSLDFGTCTWAWSKEYFGGAAPVTKQVGPEDIANAQSTSVQGKFIWVPALGCFAWHDGPSTTGMCADGVVHNGIVQLWRPPGTTLETGVSKALPDARAASRQLLWASPNPFNAANAVRLSVPAAMGAGHESYLRLAVYDAKGGFIRELASGVYAPGLHSFAWNGQDAAGRPVSEGIYLFRLTTGDGVWVVKGVMTR